MNHDYAQLALVSSMLEALNIEHALKEAQIPYLRQNRSPLAAYNDITMIDEYIFFVPHLLLDKAIEAIQYIYEVTPENMPENCPACGAATIRGQFTCPDCGLNLA